MADPVVINPTLTLAGQAAAFSASGTGLELEITHVSFGTAHYDPTGNEVALVSPVGNKVPVAGGSRPTPYQIRMVSSWRENVGQVAIGEIAWWAGETLVFVWSKADGTLASYKTDGVAYVLFNDLSFSSVPANSISFTVDPNESVAIAALAAHEGAQNAHPQYVLRAKFPDYQGHLWGDVGGSANTITLTLPEIVELTRYIKGNRFSFKAIYTNTGATTINIDGVGPVEVLKTGGVPLTAGSIIAGGVYDVCYDGAKFQLTAGAGFASAEATKAEVVGTTAVDSTSWVSVRRLLQAMALKASLAGANFTGPVYVPTQAAGNKSLLAANTEFVMTAIASLVASSPATLDTLNELAAALGNDPNFATTVTNLLAGKADKATTQPLDSDLTALAALVTVGFYVNTGVGSVAARSIAAGSGISVSNGDGVAGNPLISLSNSGVVAGNYSKVTVDLAGRVTAGSNPNTLAGFGITDAFTKAESNAAMQAAIAALVASSPAALDTLNELATAIGNDPNFATTMTNILAGKAAIVDVVRNKTDGTVDAGVDWNTIVSAGRHPKLAPGDSPNGPGSAGSYFYPEVMYHGVSAFTQLAYPYATGSEAAGTIYFRSRYNGTWYPWRALQHSGHYASKTEAEEGTASNRLMSPLAVSQAIASHAPPGFISGLSLAVNATTPNTDIDVEVGRARDSTDTVDLILAAGLTKRFQAAGAWSAGAGGNALFPGAKVANTFYHFFLIRKDSDGSVDVGFDTSLVAANRPAGYSKFVRLKGRAVKTDASGNIIPFINIGNSMEWKTLQRDMQLTNATPGSTTVTISVPPGVRSRARVYAAIAGEMPVIFVRSPESSAAVLAGPQGSTYAGGIGLNNDGIAGENLAGYCEVLTNQSAQVVVQAYAYPGYQVILASLHTVGWTEV